MKYFRAFILGILSLPIKFIQILIILFIMVWDVELGNELIEKWKI